MSEIETRRDLVQARRISQMPTPMHVLLVAGIQQRMEKRTHDVLDNVRSSVLSSVERLTKRVCIRMCRDCFQQVTNYFFFLQVCDETTRSNVAGDTDGVGRQGQYVSNIVQSQAGSSTVDDGYTASSQMDGNLSTTAIFYCS